MKNKKCFPSANIFIGHLNLKASLSTKSANILIIFYKKNEVKVALDLLFR